MLDTGSVRSCVCLCAPLRLPSSFLVGIINRKWEVSLARLHVTLHRAVCPALQLCCNCHGKTPGLYKDKIPHCFLAPYPDRSHPYILVGHFAFNSCRSHVQSPEVQRCPSQSNSLCMLLFAAFAHQSSVRLWSPCCREINDSWEKNASLKTESDKSSGGNQLMWLEGRFFLRHKYVKVGWGGCLGGFHGNCCWNLAKSFNMKPKQLLSEQLSTLFIYFKHFQLSRSQTSHKVQVSKCQHIIQSSCCSSLWVSPVYLFSV